MTDAGQARKQEDTPKCQLCGEPMPPGEEMFNYHGYSGDCPKPPLPRNSVAVGDDDYVAFCRYTERGTIATCDSDAPKAFKVYRRREAAAQPSAPLAKEKSLFNFYTRLDRGFIFSARLRIVAAMEEAMTKAEAAEADRVLAQQGERKK